MNASIDQASTIVTGSDRLARHLHERVADVHLAAGRRVWERPDILPIGAFWRRLAVELQQHADVPLARRRVLSRTAAQCRFETFIHETFADRPLLQTSATARAALDAWQACRDWRLDIDALANDPLEETRALIAWGRRFERECAEREWLPDYALPDAVLAVLEQFPVTRALLPARIQLAGFVEMSPLAEQRWNALRALGVTVDTLAAPRIESVASRLSLADVRAETRAVAAWAREQLQRNPRQRLGIVVPDLGAHRAALKRALIEALCPERVMRFDDAPLPFNFSLGEPLADVALVADALTVLALSTRRVEFTQAARLCRSPYVGSASEAASRFALEAVLRREGYAAFSLRDWQFLARREGAPAFAQTLEDFVARLDADRDDVLPSQWARRFSEWLAVFGWCRARALDSAEYQARTAWNETLGRMSELDAVLGACNRSTALTWLNRLAAETAFQPRATDAPVQVLGLLEATGMQFDALWVMGLTDDVLPAAPRPNPFLPVALQRAKRMPQSSAARELEFARAVFDGLLGAAPQVVVSHPLREGDAELGASPLAMPLPAGEPPTPFATVAEQFFGSAPLESISDARAPAHPGGDVRGGTGLLTNQSHCPFRAFAIHRLRADDWPTPQPGPDALVRGLLAHRVLERLWRQWRTRAALEAVHANGELASTVTSAVNDALDEIVRQTRHRWTDGLRDIERRRLVNVLLRWFEHVELPRASFTVVEIEGQRANGEAVETRVTAGPLTLTGKLDRVDELTDGGELIIDYKTGAPPSRSDFFGARPRAPQLPAYVLARKQARGVTPVGIAVGSLRAGSECLQGVMHDDGNAPSDIVGVVDVAKSRHALDWADAVEQWQATIDALGTSFAAGDARVEPLPGACEYCHLATLCRIHEAGPRTEDADE